MLKGTDSGSLSPAALTLGELTSLSESQKVVGSNKFHGLYSPWITGLEYWNGYPFPSPGDLPNPGIKPKSPTFQADSLPSETQERPQIT